MRRRLAIPYAAAAIAAAAGVALAAPGDIALVSVSSGGAQGATPAEASAVSADGRFVAFTSASALTATPTGGNAQLYVRDRVAGTTAIASKNAAGQAADAAVDVENVGNVQFSISGSGRYVVFASAATNLTPADTDANTDVFRVDLQTGAVALVSVNSAGQKANAAVFGDPDVSYDGRRVSFGSGAATNLFAPDANGNLSDIVVRDLAAGTTTLAAVSQAGVQANGTTERSAISADGNVVVFEAPTGTNNLLPGDASPGDVNDVVVRNLAAGTTTGGSNPAAASGSGFPDVSGSGRYVVFETDEAYDPANDAAGKDVYRRDTATGAFALASAVDGATTRGNGNGDRAAVNADGGRVVFRSASTNLTGADANDATLDVYARDVAERDTRRASERADGGQVINESDRGAVAGNGAVVSFVSSDAGTMLTLTPNDANSQPDVFAKEFVPTDTTGPAIAPSGGGGTATDPSGIGEVTVNGAPVTVGAAGAFTAPALPAGAARTIRAVDGAGNASQVTIAPTGAAPGRGAVRPRILRLSASLKGKKLTVRLRIDRAARVTVTLLRRTVKKKPRRRIVLTTAAKPVTRSLPAGQRTIVLNLKKRPKAGRYVVRARARAGGLVATRTVALVVTPPKKR